MSRKLVYFVMLLLVLSISARSVDKVSRKKIRIRSRNALSPLVNSIPVISWATNDVSKVFGFWSDSQGRRIRNKFRNSPFIRIQMKRNKRVKRFDPFHSL